MSAVVALSPLPAPARPAPANHRAAALAEFDQHLDNLRRCVHWLVGEGVAILDADMRRSRARPRLNVAPSPRLHILCKEDCANIGRRNDGALTVHLWIAQRHGCDILWEEVTCA